MTPEGFEILYEDNSFLIVNKPGGVLTQAPPGIDSMEVRIKRFLKSRDEKPGNVYLAVPHRLDRPVSGAMVFAKNVRAARRIAEQFEDRLVKKTYWAIVSGVIDEDEGTWTDYVRKVPDQPRAEIVSGERDGKIAVLHFRVRERLDANTWIEVELETGRTHQIRLQCSSRGSPILGDEMYGSGESFGPQESDTRLRSIGLHARSLSLRHPKTREMISASADLPQFWLPTGFDFADCDGQFQ